MKGMLTGAIVALAVVCLGWLVVVVVFAARGAAAVIGPIGTALSPVGWLITAAALFQSFKQRHEDSERAHRDKLAEAYSGWFSTAWELLGRAIEIVDTTHADINRDLPRFVHALKVDVYPMEVELRTLATRILMFEDDEDRAENVRKTFAPFPSWSGPVPLERKQEYVEFAGNIRAVLRDRRANVEAIFQEAGKALASTTPC